MKAQRVVIFAVCFLFCLSSQLQAENLTIYGCYQKINGQLRIVQNPEDCRPPERFISWNGQSSLTVSPLVIYVNGATGVDDPAYGLTAQKPFKTIGYALGRVPIMRANPDIQAQIHVASGEYPEAINMSIDNIWLRGAGRDSTSIKGTSDPNASVVFIAGTLKNRITGFTIKNGGYGVLISSASLDIRYCIISNNNGYAGLFAQGNSYVNAYDLLIRENVRGVFTIRNSTVMLEGNSKVYDNTDMGVGVWYTSTFRLRDGQVYSNGSSGIQAGAGSSLRISRSKIYDNKFGGVDVGQMSTVAFRGGNSIYSNADGSSETWQGGVGAFFGSVIVFTMEDSEERDRIYENSGPGLILSNNSVLFMPHGEVKNNDGNGVSIELGSRGQFADGASITNNTGWGISCFDGSGIYNIPGAVVSGNTVGQINCP